MRSSDQQNDCTALLCLVVAACRSVSEARQLLKACSLTVPRSLPAKPDLGIWLRPLSIWVLVATPDLRAVRVQHGLAMKADAALRGARAMAVAELAAEPKLREVMRDLFYQHAVLSTSARPAIS